MKDMVAAVSVGRVEDKLLVDLTYDEESYPGEVADIPIAMTPRTGQLTLLQMDGKVSAEQLKTALEMGKNACREIYEVQKNALKDKFKVGDKSEYSA
jgi:exosome complex component RRP41